MTDEAPVRRRRGSELEGALLDAAWEELQANGYAGLTYDAVAARAGTSKPALYRRWPTKADLVVATMRHAGLFERRAAAGHRLAARGRRRQPAELQRRPVRLHHRHRALPGQHRVRLGPVPRRPARTPARRPTLSRSAVPRAGGAARRDPDPRLVSRPGVDAVRPVPARPDHDAGAGARGTHRRDRRRPLAAAGQARGLSPVRPALLSACAGQSQDRTRSRTVSGSSRSRSASSGRTGPTVSVMT